MKKQSPRKARDGVLAQWGFKAAAKAKSASLLNKLNDAKNLIDLLPTSWPKMLLDTHTLIPVTRRIGGGEAVVLQTQIMSGVFCLRGEYTNYGSDNGDW